MEALIEQNTEAVKKVETYEEYLRRTFLRKEGEFKVDFRAVGPNRFRINFWSRKVGTVSDNKIVRSYYVVLNRCGTEWSHTIK